jgi:hypothetical protein
MGVMEKRFEAHAAPSGLLFVTGGMVVAMIELRGKAMPRIPLNFGPRGSFCTVSAEAGVHIMKLGEEKAEKLKHTKSLIVDCITPHSHLVPYNRPLNRSLEVGDVEILIRRS